MFSAENSGLLAPSEAKGRPWHCDSRNRLPQLGKFFRRDSELAENLEEERWSYFSAAVNWDGHSSPVWMNPPFMTPCSSIEDETQLVGDALKISRRSARH